MIIIVCNNVGESQEHNTEWKKIMRRIYGTIPFLEVQEKRK